MFIEALPHTIAIFGNSDIQEKSAEIKRTGQRLGTLIAEHDMHIAFTIPLGFPLWVAEGMHKAHGTTIMFSHAKSLDDHLHLHRLPLADVDIPIFTGQPKNINLDIVRASTQAVIFGPAKADDIDLLVHALQSGNPVGILEGSWRIPESFTSYLAENPQYQKQTIKTNDINFFIVG